MTRTSHNVRLKNFDECSIIAFVFIVILVILLHQIERLGSCTQTEKVCHKYAPLQVNLNVCLVSFALVTISV